MSETGEQWAERIAAEALASIPADRQNSLKHLFLVVGRLYAESQPASRLRPVRVRAPERTHAAMSAPRDDE